MMKKSFFFAVIALVCLLAAFTSCHEDDITPALMHWQSVNGQATNNISSFDYEVGAEGGEYDFVCTNYKMFNLVQILDHYPKANVNELDSIDYYTFPQNDSLQTVYDQTGTIKVISKMAEVTAKGAMLNVKIKPNTSGTERKTEVGIMASNAGTQFTFTQAGK